jgi:hypothetical protein
MTEDDRGRPDAQRQGQQRQGDRAPIPQEASDGVAQVAGTALETQPGVSETSRGMAYCLGENSLSWAIR